MVDLEISDRKGSDIERDMRKLEFPGRGQSQCITGLAG